ncbi:hypothetical protein [Cupriavidus pampae]|uniref:DUF4189 domain-containing protein n=1 Tax=Cupriavidus pampae TaxID=659251 RepID=A0ABN7YH41_9BURK|nr:hypothetical protein [Cupriavidus pampae]CAG9172783.1 hypothetical protein LMG32289_02678 [Cupriavidus pampae]
MRVIAIALVIASSLFAGCASIVSGTNQVVSVETQSNGQPHEGPTGYADAANVDAVPYMRARNGYAIYRDRKAPKAFVLADGGHYALWANNPNAIEKAMARCRDMRFTNCRLYAYDDVVVWPRGVALTPEDPPEGESRSKVVGRGDPRP